MLALGTDGAANLCGKTKSLFTLLKHDIPDLILVKCTYQSHVLNFQPVWTS
jgi:hypothetical protein